MKNKHHFLKITSALISLILVFSLLNQNAYASKKGLQGIESAGLSTKHSLCNLILTEYINTSGGVGYETLGSFTSGGTTRNYYLNVLGLSEYGQMIKNSRKNSELQTVSVILLARKMTGITDTSSSNSPYYAFNTWTDEGVRLNTKLMNLTAQALGSAADYFIMQNEVNNPHSWMEMGDRSIDDYVMYYEKACRMLDSGLRAANSTAKVMISLDYFWNSTDGGRYNAKDLLLKFAAKAKADGDYNWGVAHHAYPCPLTDSSFIDDNNEGLTKTESTRIISLYNIEVLTAFMKRNELLYNGAIRDITISESGFNAYSNGKIDEERQAAMYAYAYYKIESLPEIKAFIIRAYIDLEPEPSMGLYFGMYDKKWHQREILDLMKYIDTQQGILLTKKYLKYFNVSSWNDLIPGFDKIVFEQSKLAVGLNSSVGTNVGKGQEVTWTAEAAGGKSPYQYRFTYIDPSYQETVLSEYSENNTLVSGIPIIGDSHIRVEVKDADGKVASRMIWLRYDPNQNTSKYGDINNDGVINAIDRGYMVSHMIKKYILTGTQFELADINGDGAVNSIDYGFMVAYSLKRITSIPQR